MLPKSNYLYSTVLLIFSLIYFFLLFYPTQENIRKYQIYSNLDQKLPSYTNKIMYSKLGVVKYFFYQNNLSTRRYRISCPNSFIYIDRNKNTFRISEQLENAQILLQEREGTKNSCRLFLTRQAFCNYRLKSLSSPELYFSMFDSFFPIPTHSYWQGVAKGASLSFKKNSSPILQTDFITFFTPKKI